MNGQFDFGSVSPRRYFVLLAVCLGLVFGFIAGDDGADNLIKNVLQWQMQTLLPIAILVAIHLALGKSRVFSQLKPWWQLAISGAVGALLFSPFALLIDIYFEETSPAVSVSTAAFLNEFIGVAPPVVVCWLAINAPWVLGYRFERADSDSTKPAKAIENKPADKQTPGFGQLLPPALGNEVLLLKSELHYLAVQTSKGRTLILYNLRDAMLELDGADGFQCHRSYWIARAFAESLIKKGRQGEIVTSDGQRVPVSRQYLNQVRQLMID